ncbi:hypothetical protein ACJIZ3_024177 [Penstemon smallii]|uniref:Uncharacterized protein n=1 Tax=Penstemon smallii TaxID=265156 RepID=A0ABD3TR26_9LAMI
MELPLMWFSSSSSNFSFENCTSASELFLPITIMGLKDNASPVCSASLDVDSILGLSTLSFGGCLGERKGIVIGGVQGCDGVSSLAVGVSICKVGLSKDSNSSLIFSSAPIKSFTFPSSFLTGLCRNHGGCNLNKNSLGLILLLEMKP